MQRVSDTGIIAPGNRDSIVGRKEAGVV